MREEREREKEAPQWTRTRDSNEYIREGVRKQQHKRDNGTSMDYFMMGFSPEAAANWFYQLMNETTG